MLSAYATADESALGWDDKSTMSSRIAGGEFQGWWERAFRALSALVAFACVWSFSWTAQENQAHFLNDHIVHHAHTRAELDNPPPAITQHNDNLWTATPEEDAQLDSDERESPDGTDYDNPLPAPPLEWLGAPTRAPAAWVPARSQTLRAEADTIKRRWRLLSAPSRSPPMSA